MALDYQKLHQITKDYKRLQAFLTNASGMKNQSEL
jgi:hypothetical protein